MPLSPLRALTTIRAATRARHVAGRAHLVQLRVAEDARSTRRRRRRGPWARQEAATLVRKLIAHLAQRLVEGQASAGVVPVHHVLCAVPAGAAPVPGALRLLAGHVPRAAAHASPGVVVPDARLAVCAPLPGPATKPAGKRRARARAAVPGEAPERSVARNGQTLSNPKTARALAPVR